MMDAASACYGYEDNGVMIAALSEKLFKGGAACGQYYQVSCVSGTNAGTPYPCTVNNPVTVKIVDKCLDGSCRRTIDLSQEAFASIADTAAGKINIVYRQNMGEFGIAFPTSKKWRLMDQFIGLL